MHKTEVQTGKMLTLLREKKEVDLHLAMKYLGVSESTVRRLFSRLEASGYALRYHGGIRLLDGVGTVDYSYDDMKSKYVPEKKKSARLAATLIENGDTVYLDAGTTMKHLSFAIAGRIESGELENVRFFTSSFVNFGILREKADIVLVGGKYRPERKDFYGEVTENTIDSLHFTKSFLGADGYHPVGGFTATDFETSAICSRVIGKSDISYIVISNEKFMKVSLAPFGVNADNLTVVTDRKPPSEAAEGLSQSGIKTVYLK